MEVWPENWAALALFTRLQTQWNWVHGFEKSKRAGLKYEAVYPLIDREAADNATAWKDLFGDIQAMELAVLEISA